MKTETDVIVIGAGVVGLSAALSLQARGLRVTVLDREGPAAGASAGNAVRSVPWKSMAPVILSVSPSASWFQAS